jgi:hypothetical protein
MPVAVVFTFVSQVSSAMRSKHSFIYSIQLWGRFAHLLTFMLVVIREHVRVIMQGEEHLCTKHSC